MSDAARAEFARRIETIEEAYEFMLAYAAQGHEEETGGEAGIRGFLTAMDAALDGLEAAAAASVRAGGGDAAAAWQEFLGVLGRDAARARTAVNLGLAQPGITSALIDNLNASIHVRTLLTDLFLIDEALKGQGAG